LMSSLKPNKPRSCKFKIMIRGAPMARFFVKKGLDANLAPFTSN
jgi:hypothetical protein